MSAELLPTGAPQQPPRCVPCPQRRRGFPAGIGRFGMCRARARGTPPGTGRYHSLHIAVCLGFCSEFVGVLTMYIFYSILMKKKKKKLARKGSDARLLRSIALLSIFLPAPCGVPTIQNYSVWNLRFFYSPERLKTPSDKDNTVPGSGITACFRRSACRKPCANDAVPLQSLASRFASASGISSFSFATLWSFCRRSISFDAGSHSVHGKPTDGCVLSTSSISARAIRCQNDTAARGS